MNSAAYADVIQNELSVFSACCKYLHLIMQHTLKDNQIVHSSKQIREPPQAMMNYAWPALFLNISPAPAP